MSGKNELLVGRGAELDTLHRRIDDTCAGSAHAVWRRGELYVLRHVDGREITDAEGRAICPERYKVSAEGPGCSEAGQSSPAVEEAGGPGSKESTTAAPASDPPGENAIPVAGAA